MKTSRPFTPFSRILVPVVHGCDPNNSFHAARLMIGEGKILLAGFVRVPEGKSLSTASATARQIRKTLRALTNGERIEIISPVHVSYESWRDLVGVIEEEKP
ncbi:MAG TPA: hypothetical protein VI958_09845, partial [Acidobacteriota bacterium]